MADETISQDDVEIKHRKALEAKARKQAWVAANRDRLNAYRRQRRLDGNGARRRWEREWEEKNREKINAAKRERRAKNIEKARADWRAEATRRRAALKAAGIPRDRSWEEKNKEKVRAGIRYQKAKRKGAPGRFTSSDIAEIRHSQKDRCAYCRVKLRGRGHIDHILPVARGGTNNRRNIQLTCASCNASKGAKDPMEFARIVGFLL